MEGSSVGEEGKGQGEGRESGRAREVFEQTAPLPASLSRPHVPLSAISAGVFRPSVRAMGKHQSFMFMQPIEHEGEELSSNPLPCPPVELFPHALLFLQVRCLQYARARAAQGIAEARREAETLRLPDGLVSASEAAAIAARNGAPPAREPHGEMLQRLVVEHDERIRLGAQREEVQAEKRRRVGTTAAQRALAAASRTQLDAILFAAQGLKTELTAPPPHEPACGAERAAALPDPLFCLWRAAVALLSAWATGGEEAPAAPLPTLTIDDLLAPEDASLFAPEPLGVTLRAPGDGCALSFSYHAGPHMIGVTALGPRGMPLPPKMEQRLRTLFPGGLAFPWARRAHEMRCELACSALP